MRRITMAALSAASLAGPVAAQGFDPDQGCFALLSKATTEDQLMMAAWVSGYQDAQNSTVRPVDLPNMTAIMRDLAQTCAGNSQLSLREAAERSFDAPAVTSASAGIVPGSAEDARARLSQFLQPGADLAALTAALKPSAEEIGLVYREPLATALVAGYEEAYAPGAAFGPKPGQSELLVTTTTTDALIAGDPVLDEFPGGYAQVTGLMAPGFPIVRFKFVEPGATEGMAFDGLIYVNDHWVMMPKPWRGLP